MDTDTNSTVELGQFCDDIDAHARRCWALSAAISGLGHTLACAADPMFEGVEQLVQDVVTEAKKLSDDMRVLSGDDALLKGRKPDA